jgi:hypothetical protein
VRNSAYSRGIPVHILRVDEIAQGGSTMRSKSNVLGHDKLRHVKVILDGGLCHHVQPTDRRAQRATYRQLCLRRAETASMWHVGNGDSSKCMTFSLISFLGSC